MNRKLLLGITAVLVAAAVIFALAMQRRVPKSFTAAPIIGKAALGQPAPNFRALTTHGLFVLDKAKKPVLLEVFATWCPHCQHETIALNKLYKRFGKRIDFVAVSGSTMAMDGQSPENQVDVLAFANRFHVRYPIAYDPTLKVANSYLQGGFPTIVAINRAKKIVYLQSGAVPASQLVPILQKVLRP
ncbi:MAG: TlpA family protein disulfide reductase [Vulcanimicrobiaceae bacterium]